MTASEGTLPATAKGRATRDRIIDAAAELILTHGVQGTTNPEVRAAAAVSGSQLSLYFPDKESLVRAVLNRRGDQVIDVTQRSAEGALDSIAALRSWAAFYAARPDSWRGGCRFGSLASDVLKSDLDLTPDVTAGFARWRTLFRDGLAAMQERGELRPDAHPDSLATILLAAFQGGMLLAQAEGSITPLNTALDGAIDYVESFALEARPR
ncbi:TetR/AcrR family transcriptional regulator [Mycetocola tolaasinivorans]|uniref:TetR/AcrR family transcriptional regulator n=1 Tax=Mycetocola tolaasinivorans TaxID=76635 RepID=A0A3L7AD31_9MICO|nr:TetR/AcrR family transcriptional regulator [Mycetocola tolaasinivorans]RLP77925.1 TetR/AcrR family transcriptional regulator [Mycetocola tolaasinivorans]